MSSTKPSPKFFHDRPDAKTLLKTLAAEKNYEAAIVEKDYWVMHCLWGLQQNGLRFEMKTISRRYRQHKSRGDERDRPREFLRHYYDLYMLLGMARVTAFIGTSDYDKYKVEKLKGLDAEAFASKKPFTLDEGQTFALFEKEYESMSTLLLSKGPSFKELIERLREYSSRF